MYKKVLEDDFNELLEGLQGFGEVMWSVSVGGASYDLREIDAFTHAKVVFARVHSVQNCLISNRYREIKPVKRKSELG